MLETATDVRKDLRRETEVALRADEALVPHVGCEERQLGREIIAFAVPTRQGMDGKGVPQLMQARSLAPAQMGNATFAQETAVA